VIPCGMWVPVAVWQPCELLYACYLLTYLRSAGHARESAPQTARPPWLAIQHTPRYCDACSNRPHLGSRCDVVKHGSVVKATQRCQAACKHYCAWTYSILYWTVCIFSFSGQNARFPCHAIRLLIKRDKFHKQSFIVTSLFRFLK